MVKIMDEKFSKVSQQSLIKVLNETSLLRSSLRSMQRLLTIMPEEYKPDKSEEKELLQALDHIERAYDLLYDLNDKQRVRKQ